MAGRPGQLSAGTAWPGLGSEFRRVVGGAQRDGSARPGLQASPWGSRTAQGPLGRLQEDAELSDEGAGTGGRVGGA